MKKRTWKKGLAVMLSLVLGIQIPMGTVLPTYRVFAYTERSATINASSLNVRSGPGTGYSSVAKLARGTAITVINETTGSDGRLWYQIRFTGSGGAAATGYVLSTYVKFPVAYSHDTDFESYLNAQGFPDSYKDGLRQLHAQYPNWIFTAQHTGLDWNTVIQNEGALGRNLVHTSSISSYKSLVDGAYNWDNGTWTGFDGSTWVAASEDILRYYMDPRNFLDEASVFQFLSQKYDANLHTRDGLQSMLNGTFMEGGLKAYGGGASTGSGGGSGSSGGGNGSSGGPGVVSGGSSGNHSSGVVTAGQSGRSIDPADSSRQPGGSGSLGNSSAPTNGTPEIKFEAPQASVSPHKTPLVGTATMIPSGPPTASGDNQNNGSASPGGGAAVTPGGGAVSNPGGSAVITPGGGAVSNPGGSAVVTPGGGQDPDSNNGNNGNPSNVPASRTYVDVIMEAAGKSGVNPYVIAAMIIQEQGRDGRGNSISGNYGGYTGYYNYFNVGAYASDGMGAVVRGLWYASQSGSYGRPWNSVESSIIGGAQFYGTNYVSAGQDTLYLKKYNVQGSNMYKHQYMTNVDGAAAEGRIFAEGFSASLKNTALQFRIPVYQNMPGTPCAKPTADGSPNNKLSSLGADGFALTPTFNKDTVSYDLIVDHSVSNVTIYANAIDSKAAVSGTGNIQLQSGVNEILVTVRAENGSERQYMIHIVRQAGGPTYNAGMSGGNNGTSVIPGGGNSSGGPGVVGPGMSSPGGSNGGASNVVTPGGGASGSPSGGTGNAGTPGGNNVTIISPAG